MKAAADSGEWLKEGWDSGEREYKMPKRHASLRTRVTTHVAKLMTRGRVGNQVRPHVFVSVRVLGPSPRLEGEEAGSIYTLGPRTYLAHWLDRVRANWPQIYSCGISLRSQPASRPFGRSRRTAYSSPAPFHPPCVIAMSVFRPSSRPCTASEASRG